MAASPTVRRRRLTARLRQLREASGKTIDEVAQNVGVSKSALSRIENGVVGVKIPVLRALLAEYGVTGDQAAQLEQLAREAGQRGWWQVGASIISDDYKTFVGLEEEAAWINSFSNPIIYGLLQTREYATALSRAIFHDIPKEDIDLAIEIRMRRQQRLGNLRLWVILPEEVLRRPVGGPELMRRQIEQLVSLSEKPSITIQVVGMECGEYVAMGGGFSIVGFDSPDPDVVYVEGHRWDACLEDSDQVEIYRRSFDVLRAVANSPTDSRMLMQRVAKDLTRD